MGAAVAELLFAGAPTAGMQAAQQPFFFPTFSPQQLPQLPPKGSDLPQEILLRWIRTAGSCIFVIRLKFLQ